MVIITIFPKKLSEEFEATTNSSPPIITEFKDASPPIGFFSSLIADDSTWEIDFSKASSTQTDCWWFDHLLVKCKLAFMRNAMIFLGDIPLEDEGIFKIVIAVYIEENRQMLEIQDDTPELLLLEPSVPCGTRFLKKLSKRIRKHTL